MNVQPLYLPENTKSAYQLNWSLSVFGKESLPTPEVCIAMLRESTSRDQIKILEFKYRPPNLAQFFVSSKPQTKPSEIVRSIKGRWQNISQPIQRIEFRRNYRITSVGSANSDILDSYVRKQPARHLMANTNVQSMIEEIQFHNEEVDLHCVCRSSHGEYRYALHVVLEADWDWHETRQAVLMSYRSAIIKSCVKHSWRLSRVGLLANHLHILVGPSVDDSPNEVAFSFLNNLAFTQGMKPIFRFGFFAGTFGEYDRGAIWNSLDRDAASARTSRTESDSHYSEGL